MKTNARHCTPVLVIACRKAGLVNRGSGATGVAGKRPVSRGIRTLLGPATAAAARQQRGKVEVAILFESGTRRRRAFGLRCVMRIESRNWSA